MLISTYQRAYHFSIVHRPNSNLLEEKHFPNRIEILALKAKLLRELEQLIILFKLAKKLVPKNDAKEFSDVVAWIEVW